MATEKRLIDANEFLNRLNNVVYDIFTVHEKDGQLTGTASVGYYTETIEEVLKQTKTVDAVEVVRCKDCKHKPTGSGVNHHIEFPEQDYRCPCRCEDYWYSWMPYDDWFCANGERREDG